MQQAKWVEREADQVIVSDLSEKLNISKNLSRVLVGRKIDSLESAQKFLSPSLKDMKDPSSLAGIDKAVERIIAAIKNQGIIGIFGDYDVDGITSTTLLWDFLESLGAEVVATIPNRLIEGYGLSRAGVDRLKDAGAKLIITVDCGITAHDEIKYAVEKDLEVIVVDHHTAGSVLPEAVSVINPHRLDCPSESTYLCAVGVVFNLCVALRRELRNQKYFENKKEPNIASWLDIVALGTVADVVPLVNDNRLFVKYGLREMQKSLRPGINALLEIAALKSKLSASTLGFQLGPRLNAAGRLSDAMAGVNLLRSRSSLDSRSMAELLDKQNLDRRAIEKQILEEAIEQIETNSKLKNSKSLVVFNNSWHPGVVGIVASRIVDKYSKPAIVLGENGKGSGRSIPAFHLHEALTAVKDKLDGFGGHAHAVGVHLGDKNLDDFRDALAEYSDSILSEDDLRKTFYYDGELESKDLNLELIEELEKAKPFGRGNPEPVFRISNADFSDLKELNGGHMRGKVFGKSFIAFGLAEKFDSNKKNADILATPELNEWNGRVNLQLRIKDIAELN